MKWILLGIVCMLLLLFFLTKHLPSVFPPHRQIALGFWTQGLYDPKDHSVHPDTLLSLQREIKKKVTIAHFYIGWEDLANPDFVKNITILQENSWIPMVSTNPYFFSDCPAVSIQIYKAIAAGDCDEFLHQAGKNLSKINKPFYFVFAWEMNNKANQWSVPYTNSNSSDFIAAWQHIHGIFVDENVKKIMWVFDPNTPEADISYSSLYPGDKYVDYLGLDGYNWGTTQTWSQWVNFAGIFRKSYDELVRISAYKKIILVEVNTANKGGDKGVWYTDMLTQQIPYDFPHISAVVFFNEDRTFQEGVNWKIDVNQESLASFISAIHSSFY